MTVRIPATEPANVTVPDIGARTSDPTAAAKSTPQCPAYAPTGAKEAVWDPGTGAIRQTKPTAIHMKRPPRRTIASSLP